MPYQKRYDYRYGTKSDPLVPILTNYGSFFSDETQSFNQKIFAKFWREFGQIWIFKTNEKSEKFVKAC